MRTTHSLFGLCLAATIAAPVSAGNSAAKNILERGRYAVATSGGNDCHTVSYPESRDKTAQAEWLTGSLVGFSGPGDTTYPANLRTAMK